MEENGTFGRRLRLRHLYRRPGSGLLVVPLDHAIAGGPLHHRGDLDNLVASLADNGADAVVLHKGAARRVHPARFRRLSLVLHLNASTGLAPDPDAKYPVATVEEALRLGAEAVSVHINVSSLTESRQIAHLALTAEDCDRWGVPLLAMMYVRGPEMIDGRAPELISRALTVAAELGADLVKTSLPATPDELAPILTDCPIPVLAAGGPVAGGLVAGGSVAGGGGSAEVVAALADAVRAGAGGIAAGRLVFTAPDPGAMVRQLATLVHDRTAVAAR
ncbi:2-amino-3,7-dideoxy-D-threo-hept-6-ulosonate synthase [Winogradskya humida]|uniref:Fructose-bisphosphate aldolase n=1 Tax=Winogradskya humida TaxID=113566 RepID=A0ABQ3ZYR2_9ACTN|nr:2-amino-3,7-dideoxy-D-threo-hept-6-ulosonate synthase [Actinoplanes humidus]GIE23790.1 fructose-bisphosphate aldolase [Actinoplanes humidus]